MPTYRTADNLLQAFLRTARAAPGRVALRCAWDPRFASVTWSDYEVGVARVAATLRVLGLRPADRVVISLPNCAVFHLVDLGVVAAGGVPVSVYASASRAQVSHILRSSDARLAIVRPEHRERFEAAARDVGRDLRIVESGPDAGPEAVESWLAAGRLTDELGAPAATLTRASTATVIYTSGTTGAAKGVILTHGNVINAFEVTIPIVGNDGTGTRIVSYLPMAHVAERMSSHYNHLLYGSEVHCCPSPDGVFDMVKEVRPHVFFGPPRIWEKVVESVEPADRQGQALATALSRRGLGEVRVAVSGAAPMPRELFERLRGAGLPLSEVFGLSETTGVLTWDHALPRAGSVGRPLPRIEVRIAADGEIQARGPVVFAGYAGDADATRAAFTADGWFRTGDVGRFDEDGYLHIVGRAKELIVTAGGKNVAPAVIEGRLCAVPGVSQAMLVGDGRPFVGALVVLEPGPAPESIVDRVADAIADINSSVSRAEGVRRFLVLADEWTSSDGLLTPTSKLRRSAIEERFANNIDALYDGREGYDVPPTTSRA